MFARLLPILGITFIDIIGFSMLLPVLPYFAKHFGASDFIVGILFATFAACQFAAGPVWGFVSDRIGRKMVLIVSQIGATFGWTILAFAHSLPIVFLARVIEGASGGNISVTQAYVADLVEPEKRAKAFAYVGAAFSAGFVLGPAFGGVLLDRFGFSAPFLAAAAFQFATLLLTIFMLPESRSRDPEAKVATFADVAVSLADRRVSPVLLQSWAFSLGLYAWFGIYALLLQAALNFTARDTSFMMAAFGGFSVFMQLFVVSRVYDAVGDRIGSNIGITLAACGFFLTPFIHSIPTLIPNILLFSAGMALARPGISSILSARAPAEQRGSILGTASALDNLSGVIMPPVSTGLLGRYGQSAAGVPSLFFAVVALVMGLVAQRREAAGLIAQRSEAAAE